ncbi:MAG: hypothetical protein HYU60_03725 [Magnetospirillum sp.]|nr:hypothetical protein [Magnetospirillum sp.]
MPPGRQVLFEFTRIGNTVKVTALDSISLVEVSVIGPATASQAQMKTAALRKLDYMLAKKQGGG